MSVDDQVELLGLDDDIQQDLLVFPFIRWLGNANLGEDPPGLAVLAAEEPDVSAAALDQGVFYWERSWIQDSELRVGLKSAWMVNKETAAP